MFFNNDLPVFVKQAKRLLIDRLAHSVSLIDVPGWTLVGKRGYAMVSFDVLQYGLGQAISSQMGRGLQA